MSFLKRLFGGDRSEAGSDAAARGEPEAYRGFLITPTPMQEGGQFRLSALIEKEFGGETKSHQLIRADLFPGRQEAETSAVRKAQRMIDEQGDALFD